MTSSKNLRISARRYMLGVVVYSLAMALYTQNGYYVGFIQNETLFVLKTMYFLYLIIGLPLNIVADKRQDHKPELMIRGAVSLFRNKRVSEKQRNAILFGLVKIFYVPLMLNFFFSNYSSVMRTDWQNFNFRFSYVNILSVIFTIDTLYFVFGYLFEHKLLKNVVKSVESTSLGWAVALASYPPFNSISTRYLGWYSSDYFFLPIEWVDYLFKILIVLLLLLYLWATLSLGTKCSNLTNRGIVRGGAYKYIRHPAYTGKVLAWWIMGLSRLSIGMIFSLSAWTLVYFMRAITEERHLIKDPDYQEYCRKVKYRFIPYVW